MAPVLGGKVGVFCQALYCGTAGTAKNSAVTMMKGQDETRPLSCRCGSHLLPAAQKPSRAVPTLGLGTRAGAVVQPGVPATGGPARGAQPPAQRERRSSSRTVHPEGASPLAAPGAGAGSPGGDEHLAGVGGHPDQLHQAELEVADDEARDDVRDVVAPDHHS